MLSHRRDVFRPGLLLAVAAALLAIVSPGRAQEAVTVHMIEFSFQPREQVINADTPIRWVNRDAFPHAIAMQGGRPGSSPGLIDAGKDYTFVFREAGRFVYRCGVHPTMLGAVIVQSP